MGTSNTATHTSKWGTVYSKATGAYGETSAEYAANVKTFYNYMVNGLGYTHNAACAILGNMYAESGMNPWRWQSDVVRAKGSGYTSIGYGLGQYTPADKYVNNQAAKQYKTYGPNYSDQDGKGSDWYAQLYFNDKISGQRVGGYGPQYGINASYNYPITWKEFTSGTYTLEYLSAAWLHNWERPADQSASVEALRYSYAQTAAQVINDDPPEPGPGPDPGPVGVTIGAIVESLKARKILK